MQRFEGAPLRFDAEPPGGLFVDVLLDRTCSGIGLGSFGYHWDEIR